MLAVEGALAKIERVLPEGLRSRVQAVQSVVAFQPAPAVPQPQGEIVSTLSLAAHQQRRVELCYRSRGEETVRRFDPYGLVYHWSRWYVVGWCHLRQDVRVFRLDRVVSAEIEDQLFIRPPDFDSLQSVLESLALVPWEWSVEVLLETTFEDAQRRIPPGSALLEQSEGGVLLRIHSDRLDWLACMLLTLECPFVVRRPPELREALRQIATRAAALAERSA
jgi:predicted DNA-binding transcriptional regulator YafY